MSSKALTFERSSAPEVERPNASQLARARQALESAFGTQRVVSDPDVLATYAEDKSGADPHPPDLVVRVESTEEVRQVFATATEHRIPVTPRGLGTGKSGGALAVNGGIVLSLERMNRIRELRREDMFVTAEAGVITLDMMNAVEAEGLFYPPDPNSLDVSSIGGNAACNAGGPRALKYGVTRNYILGLKVVVPTGEVFELGGRTIKQVAGYDLTGLLVGSEGTLGVITEVTCRLIPLPAAVQTALVSFADVRLAGTAVTKVLDAGIVPRTLELLDDKALEVVRNKTPGRFPENAGALLILETDATTSERAFEDLERAANICMDASAIDVLVAQDEVQRQRIWEPRRVLSTTLSESAPRKVGHDIVVPRSQIPEMLVRTREIAERHRIGVATYGHAGDGNLHVNILFDDASRDRADAAVREVMETTIALRGTISGEHGVGLLKREFLGLEQSSELIALQRALKAQFDPHGILNPGKVFPSRGVRE